MIRIDARSNAAAILRQRWGSFAVYPESEYMGGSRRHTSRASIDSRSGTVLLKATANVDEDDLRLIVQILNEALG